MKVTAAHYALLLQGLKESRLLFPTADYFREVVARSDKPHLDFAALYRWELFHAAFSGTRDPEKHAFSVALYTYCNDSHIDTALRKAVQEIASCPET